MSDSLDWLFIPHYMHVYKSKYLLFKRYRYHTVGYWTKITAKYLSNLEKDSLITTPNIIKIKDDSGQYIEIMP